MHTLILGQSFTGKSAKAKQLGTQLRAQGQTVIAFNPMREHGYTIKDAYGCLAAEFDANTPQKFMAELNRIHPRLPPGGKIYLIIDEAHKFFPHTQCETSWIGTEGRHHGLSVIAITQKATLVDPTFRSQCSVVYVFRAEFDDMEMIRKRYWQYNLKKEDLILAQGEYLRIHHSDGVTKGNISDW